MPEKLLYDYLPGWDSFRAPGRFIMMTNLSMAILSAFAINGLHKRSPAIKSTKDKTVLVELLLILASEFLFLNLYGRKR